MSQTPSVMWEQPDKMNILDLWTDFMLHMTQSEVNIFSYSLVDPRLVSTTAPPLWNSNDITTRCRTAFSAVCFHFHLIFICGSTHRGSAGVRRIKVTLQTSNQPPAKIWLQSDTSLHGRPPLRVPVSSSSKHSRFQPPHKYICLLILFSVAVSVFMLSSCLQQNWGRKHYSPDKGREAIWQQKVFA